MKRKSINTTLREDLYSELQILSIKLSQARGKKVNVNDLLEEGMEYVIQKYSKEGASEKNSKS